jgi:anti-sigma regulatory factor (Ser/Thr protein kinase)
MQHVDISHLDYATAMDVIQKIIPDLSCVDVSIDFSADHSQSKIIRDFVGSIFDHEDIRVPWAGRFILITDELVNNAIEHGSSEGDIDSCLVKAGRDEAGSFSISLEVHDTGSGKDAKKPEEMNEIKNAHQDKEGDVYMDKRGRGLFRITEKLVDRLEFRESAKGGLAVRIEKVIPKSV